MTEMFGEAWSPMSVPHLAPDDDDDEWQDMTKRIKTTRFVERSEIELLQNLCIKTIK